MKLASSHLNLILVSLILSIFPKVSFPSHTESSSKRPSSTISSNSISSTTETVENLANLAVELSSSQNAASEKAALKARQYFADVSLRWAIWAKYLAYRRSLEVQRLTAKAQEALITSLKFGSIATQLKSAVLIAQEVYNSAAERLDTVDTLMQKIQNVIIFIKIYRSKTLSSLANLAENQSEMSSKAYSYIQYIQNVREKWASNEKERAYRLSMYLQDIFNDLKKASELSKQTAEIAEATKNYKPLPYFGSSYSYQK